MNSVEKGRIAEAKVVACLVSQGLEVFTPIFGNAQCDLVVLVGSKAVRIEVKYGGAYEINLRQTRANRAQMIVKKFNSSNCDILGIYLALLDKVVFLDASVLNGRTSVTLPAELDVTSELYSENILRLVGRVADCTGPENQRV